MDKLRNERLNILCSVNCVSVFVDFYPQLHAAVMWVVVTFECCFIYNSFLIIKAMVGYHQI